MNDKVHNKLIETSKAYLHAIRIFGWFDLYGDDDTLIPLVHDLIDAGFGRQEILEIAKRMGQADEEWLDIIAGPVLEDRPWMKWGRTLN
jgi:hypothetical protein